MSNPKIVVVDGYCLNPGDLSWRRLEELGSCTIYERTPPNQLIERTAAAEILLTNKATLSRDTISALPQLKYIGVTATGYNIVDVEAAGERGVVVTNVPTYGTASVAQMVFAHILNLTQRVADHAASVRDGEWANSADWCFWNFPLLELDGLTMGIVGYGRIGRATAQLARAFGMQVIAYNRSPIDPSNPVRSVDLNTVFRESDVVSLHCPLTPETRHLISRERLALMKSTALLINTSRGPLVDEAALADALNHGTLAGAGLDVMEIEPPANRNPLYSAKNCYITPHIAWATQASRQRLLDTAIDNVAKYLQGTPQNVVNAT
jgi:glycerate dehydrogenase